MKWMLFIYLLVVFIGNTTGQDNPEESYSYSENPLNTTNSEAVDLYTDMSRDNFHINSTNKLSPTFRVIFHNFPEEAKNAFNYAVSIWEKLIYSPVPIVIEARWEELNGNILAKGNPSIFYNNFSGTPIRNVYYPVALAEKIAGKDLNAGAPDIICKFSGKYDWYFGTDGNPPSTHYDLVSSALHEITHGLGFSGFLNERDGMGYYNNNNELPSIYDYLLFNNDNQQISDKSLFRSQSTELLEQITSGNVMFCKSSVVDQQQKMIDWIFAPPVWNDGTSIYHLNGYEYGQENSLMAPYAVKGKAIHDPGNVTLSILAELGWKSINFDFSPLKDIEKAVEEWPVQVNLNTNDEKLKNIKVVYSFDGFSTANYVFLKKSEPFNYFTGSLNLGYKTGQVKYYIEATTVDNRLYRYPADAPSKPFAINIGPDIFEPDIFHNPIDIIAGNTKKLKIHAGASDNTGIKKNQIDYKINGKLHYPVLLTGNEEEFFTGSITLPSLNGTTDKLASDSSVSGFGRAIDNFEIQNPRQGNKKLYAEGSILSYPNPVKNFLYIEWNDQLPENPLNMIASDVQGRVIHQGNDFKPHQSSINPGLYVVSINDGTKVLTSDKILKN